MHDLRLTVGGRTYGGWKSARIIRGIESIAGSFDLSVTDRWAGLDASSQDAASPISAEDECTLQLDGVTVITGYVDRRSISYGPEEHTLSVAGRDRTGDLVDCSAVLSKWEYLGVSLLKLAKDLAEPFGIRVNLQSGLVLKSIDKLTIDPGEFAFEVIERACRMVGVLPVSDGVGGLLLTRAGSDRATTALVEGKNILGVSADFDAAQRYRRYIVSTQHAGTDEFFGERAAAIRAEAQDAGVRRSARVLMVRPEASATLEYAKSRAQWEAIVRAARGDAVTITVQGWKQGDGKLWPVNARVPVRCPYLGLNGEMLITQATYTLDDSQGTVTQLSLKRPDAFRPEPTVKKAGAWRELAGGV